MPYEDKNFGSSLGSDIRKRWRHLKTIYTSVRVLYPVRSP